jgi:hypothetical protein
MVVFGRAGWQMGQFTRLHMSREAQHCIRKLAYSTRLPIPQLHHDGAATIIHLLKATALLQEGVLVYIATNKSNWDLR